GIAKEREVRALLLSERRVLVERIDADHEISDVVLLDQVAVFRQRLALERAAACVRLRETGQYDCLLVPKIRDLVRLAVGRLQREVRYRIADLQLRGRGHVSDRSECEQAPRKHCGMLSSHLQVVEELVQFSVGRPNQYASSGAPRPSEARRLPQRLGEASSTT